MMQNCTGRSLIGIFIIFLSLTGAAQAQTNVSVNLVSGAAQIGYPLGEVRDNEISIPLGLSYNGTGVQISEKGFGEFGLGVNWNLSAGGSIRREVRSLPDDFKGAFEDPRKGWLVGTTAQDVATYLNGSGTYLAYKYTDTEPDIFSVSLPGLYVKFVFDNNKQIRTIPYLDVKIIPYYADPTNNSDIYKFDVITNDGIKYEFSEFEITNKYTSEYNYPVALNQPGYYTTEYNLYGVYKPTFFKSSWHLSKVSARDNRSISIKYEDATPFTYSEDKTFTTDAGELYYVLTTFNTTFKKRVVEVSSAHSKAYFNFNHGNFQAYDRIDFYDYSSGATKKVRSFALNYRNVFYKDPYASPADKEKSMRRFLESISQSTECYTFPPDKFSYYGVDFEKGETLLPAQGSYKQDTWGFFNDGPDSDPISPKMHIYDFSGENAVFYFFPDIIPGWAERYGSGYNGDQPSSYTSTPGRSKRVNPNTIHYGSLSAIYNGYGGYTAIDYEPNEYLYPVPEFGDVIFPGKGIRVRKITTHDGISHTIDQTREYEYKLADGKASGRITYPPQFVLEQGMVFSTFDMAPSSDIYYKRVTVKESGKGKTVSEFLTPGLFPFTSEGDWTATTNYEYPFSPNMEYDFERGLPYRRYEYKEGDMTTPLRETQYEYQRISIQPTEVNAFNYDLPLHYTSDHPVVWNAPRFGNYKLLTNIGKVLLTEKNYTTDPGNNTHKLESSASYFYESSNHKFLTRTTTQNSDGAVYETRYKYMKDFAGITSPADEATAAIKAMNENDMHSAPVETISSVIKGNSIKVISASLTRYKISGTGLALPAQILQLPNVDGYTAASIQTVPGGQKLVEDARYIVVRNFEAFKGITPITISDGKGRRQSLHLGYQETLPIVEISNAAANQVVFSDFEVPTGNNFTFTNPGFIAGNIVGKALVMPVNTQIQASVFKGQGKYYRFTCKIKSAASGTISLQLSNESTVFSTVNIPFTGSAKWQFIEKQVDITAAASPFTIKVSGNISLALDDVAFYPAIAGIQSYTYEPGVGKTSETDSKGNALFYEYDHMGKVSYIRDGEGNILKKNEYKYNNYPSNTPKSNFSASYSVQPSLHKGDVATYTSETNCLTPVTHNWYVNGGLVSSNPDLTYTFAAEGKYAIKHVTSHPTLGASTTERSEYVFSERKATLNIGISGPKTINSCDASYQRTFRLLSTIPGSCTWEMLSLSDGVWLSIGSGLEVGVCKAEDYIIRCKRRVTPDNDLQWVYSEEMFIHFYKDACPVSYYASCPYPYLPNIGYGIGEDTNNFTEGPTTDITGNPIIRTNKFFIPRMRKFGPYDETKWTYIWQVFENNQWVERDRFTDDQFEAHKVLTVTRTAPYTNANFKVRCLASPGDPNVWYTGNELNKTFCICPPPVTDIGSFPSIKLVTNMAGTSKELVNMRFENPPFLHVFSVEDLAIWNNPGNHWKKRKETIYVWEVFENGSWKVKKIFSGNAFEYGSGNTTDTKLYVNTTQNFTDFYVRCSAVTVTELSEEYITTSDELLIRFINH